jgi:hypothetical protein
MDANYNYTLLGANNYLHGKQRMALQAYTVLATGGNPPLLPGAGCITNRNLLNR